MRIVPVRRRGAPALLTALLALGLAAPASAGAAPFSVAVLDHVRITGDPAGPNFQNAVGDVSFTGGPFASAVLVVELESDCFPFTKWLTNPPPAPGQFPPGGIGNMSDLDRRSPRAWVPSPRHNIRTRTLAAP